MRSRLQFIAETEEMLRAVGQEPSRKRTFCKDCGRPAEAGPLCKPMQIDVRPEMLEPDGWLRYEYR